MTSTLHQCIYLFHEYCTVEEILQLRLASNDLYEVIATCEEVGSRLRYKFTEKNKITALRKPFSKIGLQLDWHYVKLDDPRIKSICTSLGKLHINNYNQSSFELKDTFVQNLTLQHRNWEELESIVFHTELKHLKLNNMVINKVSVLQQLLSYDLVSLKLEYVIFDDPMALDFTTMTNLEELEIQYCKGIQSVTLPTSIKKLYLDSYVGTPIDIQSCINLKSLKTSNSNCFNNQDLDLSKTSLTDLCLQTIFNGLSLTSLILPNSIQKLSLKDCDTLSTPIDFQSCTNLKSLVIRYSEGFDNQDLDLSNTSLTDLSLEDLYLSSLILPHSMQESYMRDPSRIFIGCTIPKVMIKNIPEPGCTEDSFTILPCIGGPSDEAYEEDLQYYLEYCIEEECLSTSLEDSSSYGEEYSYSDL